MNMIIKLACYELAAKINQIATDFKVYAMVKRLKLIKKVWEGGKLTKTTCEPFGDELDLYITLKVNLYAVQKDPTVYSKNMSGLRGNEIKEWERKFTNLHQEAILQLRKDTKVEKEFSEFEDCHIEEMLEQLELAQIEFLKDIVEEMETYG